MASWIVNHHRFFATPEPPYAVVTVRLVEQSDLLMPGSFTGDIGELSMGLGVVAAYDDVVGEDGQAFTLLSWRRASDEGGEP